MTLTPPAPGGQQLPPMIPGRWYSLGGYTGVSSWTLDTEYAFPFAAPAGSRIDALGCRAEAPATAGNTGILAMRAIGPSGPGKVLGSVVVDLASTGYKTGVIDLVMPTDSVWLTFTGQGAADPGLRHGNRPMPMPSLSNNAGSSPSTATICALSSAGDRTTPGELPDTFGAVSIVLDRYPFVYVRAAT